MLVSAQEDGRASELHLETRDRAVGLSTIGDDVILHNDDSKGHALLFN